MLTPAHCLKYSYRLVIKERLETQAVLGDGHTAALAHRAVFIVAHVGLEVCDAGHRWFVMKEVRCQIAGVKVRRPTSRTKAASGGAESERVGSAQDEDATANRARPNPAPVSAVRRPTSRKAREVGQAHCACAPEMAATRLEFRPSRPPDREGGVTKSLLSLYS